MSDIAVLSFSFVTGFHASKLRAARATTTKSAQTSHQTLDPTNGSQQWYQAKGLKKVVAAQCSSSAVCYQFVSKAIEKHVLQLFRSRARARQAANSPPPIPVAFSSLSRQYRGSIAQRIENALL